MRTRIRVRDLATAPHLWNSPYWNNLAGQWLTIIGPPITTLSLEWKDAGLDEVKAERDCDAELFWLVDAKELIAKCKILPEVLRMLRLPEVSEDVVAYMCAHELEID